MLIYNGQINYKNLKHSKLSVNDVVAMAREQGYFNLLDIKYAVFENSGHLSIIPISNKLPTVCEDINVKKEATLPCYIITDGKISYSALNEIKKDKPWLFKKLKIKNEKGLKNILLAIYDQQEDEITTHLKK